MNIVLGSNGGPLDLGPEEFHVWHTCLNAPHAYVKMLEGTLSSDERKRAVTQEGCPREIKLGMMADGINAVRPLLPQGPDLDSAKSTSLLRRQTDHDCTHTDRPGFLQVRYSHALQLFAYIATPLRQSGRESFRKELATCREAKLSS